MNRQTNNPLELFQSLMPPEIRNSLLNMVTEPTESSSRSSSRGIPTTVVRSANTITIYAEMPGFDGDSIDVEFYINQVDISGRKPPPSLADNDTIVKSSVKYGRYSESITLPVTVTNRGNVTVRYSGKEEEKEDGEEDPQGYLVIIIDLAKEEKNRFKINLGSQNKNSVVEQSS